MKERRFRVEALRDITMRLWPLKKSGKNIEPFILMPAFDEKAIFSHDGEEFMYTLEGVHEFVYDNKSYIVNKGDSIYFDSGIPHTGRSIGKKRAKILAVMYSYKRNLGMGSIESRIRTGAGSE